MGSEGLGRLDGGQKVDSILLLHFFNGLLLDSFPSMSMLFCGGSQLRFVYGVEENPMK